jgi:hypothetical protein
MLERLHGMCDPSLRTVEFGLEPGFWFGQCYYWTLNNITMGLYIVIPSSSVEVIQGGCVGLKRISYRELGIH